MANLTKDADLLACCLYKEYLNRRKNNIPKRQAILFRTDFKKSDSRISNWLQDDYLYTIGELRRAGLIRTYIDNSAVLNDEFIIYMENRFKNGFIEVTDFIAKFIP